MSRRPLAFGIVWFVGFMCGAWANESGNTFMSGIVVILVAIGTGIIVADHREQ